MSPLLLGVADLASNLEAVKALVHNAVSVEIHFVPVRRGDETIALVGEYLRDPTMKWGLV